MKNSWLRLTGGVLALILFAGCASTPEPAPAEGPWTPSELSFALSGNDPVEGFNRSMFAVTDFGMEYVVDPLGRVYTSILPRPAIEKFNNLCVNLEFPARAFSCLGRAEFGGAWDELCRFLINTTVGIAGLFDPAGAWFDIYSTESDFGQMFAAWGIGPGCTFILPFMASLNVRDGVGSIFDMAFDIKTYIPYAGYATALNRMVVAHRAYEKAVAGSADRYKTYHEMMLLRLPAAAEDVFLQCAECGGRGAQGRNPAGAAAGPACRAETGVGVGRVADDSGFPPPEPGARHDARGDVPAAE